jgi:predicted Zn-dependent protease
LPNDVAIEIGKQVRDEIDNNYRIDDSRTEIINEFVKTLNFENKVKVFVIKSNEFNAFAVPGKYIFIYSKMLDKLESHAELAALLAHEYTHISKKHGLLSVGRQLGYEIFSAVFSDDLREEIIDNSNMEIYLNYSKEFEKEADLNGLKLLKDKKIDPRGMLMLMKKIRKSERRHRNNTLSDHPSTLERIEYIEEEIEKNKYQPEKNKKLEEIFNQIKK